MHQALIEPEIQNASLDLAVLYQESAVPGHSGEHFLVWLNFPDVPKPRHQNSALGFRNHLIHCFWVRWPVKHNVYGHFADLVWQREAVPRCMHLPELRLELRFVYADRSRSGMDDVFNYSIP